MRANFILSGIDSMSEHLVTFREYLARSRAWVSLLLLAPIGVTAVFARPHLPFNELAEYGIEVLGWLAFMAGAAMRWWATLFIGGRKDAELITAGPYSICRNPLYFGTFLMTVSVGIFLQSITLLLMTGLVAIYYLFVTVSVEERRLSSTYGEAFADYCSRVPRFFPNFLLHRAPPELTIRLVGIRAEGKRMLYWSLLPMGCYLIEHLRMLPTWPANVWLP